MANSILEKTIYQEHFEELWIKHEMTEKALSYMKAREELKAWKAHNKKAYKEQFDEYIDEVKGY